jgi:hypothetical protein
LAPFGGVIHSWNPCAVAHFPEPLEPPVAQNFVSNNDGNEQGSACITGTCAQLLVDEEDIHSKIS